MTTDRARRGVGALRIRRHERGRPGLHPPRQRVARRQPVGSPRNIRHAALAGRARGRGGVDVVLLLALGRSETDGVLDFNNRHFRTTFSGRVQGQLDPATDAALSVRYTDRTFHYPTDASGEASDSNSYTHSDALLLGLQVGRRWSDAFETGATFTLNDSDHGSQDAPDGPNDNVGFFGSASLSLAECGARR